MQISSEVNWKLLNVDLEKDGELIVDKKTNEEILNTVQKTKKNILTQ